MTKSLKSEDLLKIKANYENRNIDFEYFETVGALFSGLKKEVEKYERIGIGNSQTLKDLNITEALVEMKKTVYDKTLGKTEEEVSCLKKQALVSDCYISSCNALTKDGKLINVDHSGNRVAAITYGPERVLIVAGVNKLVENEKDGLSRALKVATPLNAKRAGVASPCSKGEDCESCTQENRVCNYISIIRGQNKAGRMKIMLLNEEMGF